MAALSREEAMARMFDAHEAYAQEIRRVYAEAEQRLVEKVSRRIDRGLDQPGWVERMLAETRQVNKELQAEVGRLKELDPKIQEFIAGAYDDSAGIARADLKAHNLGALDTDLTAVRGAGIRRLAAATVNALDATHFAILRTTQDAYRNVIAQVSEQLMAGAAGTPRQAAQIALNRWADQGITGFVDKAGRKWDLSSYAEMAIRSTTAQASIAGHVDVLEANGQDLVIVSDSPDECEMCRPWEGRVLSVTGATAGYPTVADATSDGLYHANCVPGDVLASGPRPLAAFSRWYEGEVVIINTAGGIELTITPNHPILTPEGWVAAGLLNEGDHVLRYIGHEGMVESIDPDNELVPTAIGDVFDALRESDGMITRTMPTSAEDFHGDGLDGNVDVVGTDGLLRDGGEIGKPGEQGSFGLADAGLGGLLRQCSLTKTLDGMMGTPHGGMCSCSESQSRLRSQPSQVNLRSIGARRGRGYAEKGKVALDRALVEPQFNSNLTFGLAGHVPFVDVLVIERQTGESLGLDVVPDNDAALDESRFQCSDTDSDRRGYGFESFSGKIAPDTIVKIERRQFAGHVYNLHTKREWYACNSIITHNCTHSLGVFIPGVTRPMHGTANPQGYEDRQEQRGNERQIRKWKRRQAAAITDQDSTLSKAKVKEWQAKQRAFIDRTGRLREYDREQVRVGIVGGKT